MLSGRRILAMLHINPTYIGFEEDQEFFCAFHWSVQFVSAFIGHHQGSKCSGIDRTGKVPNWTETGLITEADQTLQAVHSYNSWF